MAYTTQSDLITRFGEPELRALADRDGDDTIDADVVAAAIADADALIDGYCGARYALPLSPVPGLVGALAADIARFKLHRDDPPEVVQKAYDDAIQQLLRISRGDIVLDVAGSEPEGTGNQVTTTMPDRVFSRAKMAGY
jgi:phage gp36-like protein